MPTWANDGQTMDKQIPHFFFTYSGGQLLGANFISTILLNTIVIKCTFSKSV